MPNESDLKIVILSSSAKVTGLVDQTLRKFDYKNIRNLDNGLAALKSIKEQPVGLVICDMSVKFISGWMLVKEIKTSDKLPNIPMVLMGLENSPAPDEELKQYGIVKYLKIPFRESDLSFLINSTMQLTNTSGTIENKFSLAKEALLKNSNDAVSRYEELHQLTKKSSRSSLGLAEALVQTGNLEKAGNIILEAAKTEDNNPATMMMQSSILLKRKQEDKAYEVTDKLLTKVMPDMPFYFTKSLRLYLDGDAFNSAEKVCTLAIEKNFKLPEFKLTAARIRFQQEKIPESLDLINTVQEEFGLSPDLLNLKGVCLKKIGDFPGALSSYEEALKLSPMDAKIYFNMASCAIAMKSFDSAASYLESCLRVTPNFPKAKEKLDEIYSKTLVQKV